MDTIRQHIGFIKSLIEDASVTPQHTIAYTPKMVYFALIMAKDSYFYELKINPGIRHKPKYTSYFIPCFEMVEADVVECPCAPLSGCTWIKSVQPLPEFKGEKLDMVSPLNVGHSDDYGYVSWDSIYDLTNSRRPERINNKYSIRNVGGQKYLYVHVYSKAKPKKLSLSGPFDDLLQVVNLIQNGCSGNKTICNFLNTPLDIPQNHRDKIYTKAFSIMKTLEDKNIIPDRKTDDIDGSKFIQVPTAN